jgi:hypothetical protein
MAYTLTSLTQVTDCDTLLAMAAKDKKSYEHKIRNLNFDLENSQQSAAERQAKLLIVNSEIAMLDNVIASLAEGQMKEDYITTRMRKLTTQRVLSTPGNSLTPVSRLDDELEIARLNLQITETEAFIAAVEAHKATL